MFRTWFENEALLDRFREWLSRTEEELAAARGTDAERSDDFTDGEQQNIDLPENESPAEAAASEHPFTVPPDIVPATVDEAFSEESIGLLSLIEAFTALRQELKLQTKSARGLDDNVRAALTALDSASRQFQSVQAQETQAAERAALPFVEMLVGLDESLERCERAFQTLQSRIVAEGPTLLTQVLEQRFQQLTAWQQWWSRAWHERVMTTCREEAATAYDRLFQSLKEGFTLVQTRLGRAMEQHHIRRISCVGQRVDPNRMTVVELVDAPDAPPESVVAELRPGYVWRERVLRYAEVQAARRSPS